jgi:hypothetical protein
MSLTTWARVLLDPTISLVEHPVMPVLMTKDEINTELGPVLAQLDGSTMCDTVHIFYRRDSVEPSILRFCDEDAKMDILDWAVDEGCLPPLHQIHLGDDVSVSSSPPKHAYPTEELAEELARVRRQTADQHRQKCTRDAPMHTIRKHSASILAQINRQTKALVEMRANINKVVNEGVKAFLAPKLAKAESVLQELVLQSGFYV